MDDSAGNTWSYNTDVTASSSGAFTTSFSLPSYFVATYLVTATGPVSGMATTTFTDSAASLDQCTNGSVGPPIVLEPCTGSNAAAVNTFKNWVNGNANGSKSHWFEGDFISYRVTQHYQRPGRLQSRSDRHAHRRQLGIGRGRAYRRGR